MKPILSLIFACLCMTLACHQSAGNQDWGLPQSESIPVPIADEVGQDPIAQKVSNHRKLIRTGHLQLQVETYAEARTAVNTILAKHEGYISSEEENRTDYQLSNRLSLRVPATKFEVLMSELEPLALRVEQKRVDVQDITEEFIDVESRLQSKAIAVARYRELLKQANSVSEILEIEEALRKLVEEEEANKGRLRYLADQVGYSTIHLYLYQRSEDGDLLKPGFWKRVGDALLMGWEGLVSFLILMITVWPVFVILAGVAVVVVRIQAKNRKKTES